MAKEGLPGASEEERAHDAFVRWQEIRRVQLGYTTNIVLTLAVAALGFVVKLFVDGRIDVILPGGAFPNWLSLIPLFFLGAAVALGLSVNLTRLLDFRYTARAARSREISARAAGDKQIEKQKAASDNHAKYRNQAKLWERRTRGILYAQLASFALSVFVLLGYLSSTSDTGHAAFQSRVRCSRSTQRVQRQSLAPPFARIPSSAHGTII